MASIKKTSFEKPLKCAAALALCAALPPLGQPAVAFADDEAPALAAQSDQTEETSDAAQPVAENGSTSSTSATSAQPASLSESQVEPQDETSAANQVEPQSEPSAATPNADAARSSGTGSKEDPYVYQATNVGGDGSSTTETIQKSDLDPDWTDKTVRVEDPSGVEVATASGTGPFAQGHIDGTFALGENYRAYVESPQFQYEDNAVDLVVPANTIVIKNVSGYDMAQGTITLYDFDKYYSGDLEFPKVQVGEVYHYDGQDFTQSIPASAGKCVIFAASGMAGGPSVQAFDEAKEYSLVDIDLTELLPHLFKDGGAS
jgi:hypothetical protein